MSRCLVLVLFVLGGLASSAQGQLFKKIDPNKVSDFSGREFNTKSWGTKQYDPYGTKQYGGTGEFKTKTFDTHEYSYSSKNFDTRTANYSSKEVTTKDVPYKGFEQATKEAPIKSFATKDVEIPPLSYRIADKPVTDWRTMIRRTPPSGMPGPHQDIPFSEWKPPQDTK